VGVLDLCDLPSGALSGRGNHAGCAVERSQSRGYAEGGFRKGLEEWGRVRSGLICGPEGETRRIDVMMFGGFTVTLTK
jgi:hypothetical protein